MILIKFGTLVSSMVRSSATPAPRLYPVMTRLYAGHCWRLAASVSSSRARMLVAAAAMPWCASPWCQAVFWQ